MRAEVHATLNESSLGSSSGTDFTFDFGIIGTGIMGEALIKALLASGIDPKRISFVEKRDERANEIASTYQISRKTLAELVSSSKIILLLIKPQDALATLEEISASFNIKSLLVSFLAGKKTEFFENLLPDGAKVIRVMPNTPLAIGKGASVLSLGNNATSTDEDQIRRVLDSSSLTLTLPENLQDAVTAVSGSGPAYFFAFVEAMVAAGVELGLNEADSTALTIETIYGAAAMLKESGKSATTLRENVTSPNGTTFAALESFRSSNLNEIVEKAMRACRDRSIELSS
jgi:pyrroline-5-carboxylate reductase